MFLEYIIVIGIYILERNNNEQSYKICVPTLHVVLIYILTLIGN